MMIAAFWSGEWTGAVVNHLWQSTVVVGVAWLLVFALKKNSARVRYWVWMAASLKFLLPFSALITAGERLRSLMPVAAAQSQPAVANVIEQVTQPFTEGQFSDLARAAMAAHPTNWFPFVLLAVWACGAAIIAIRFGAGWWRVVATRRAARPMKVVADVPVLTTAALMEPGIFGIMRPVLLLPEQIVERLSAEQMRAIVAHEMAHVRRRDNLTFALHMLVESLFWFHPAVWWIGAKLIEERERACDEAVVEAGGEAQVYAEGILNVCKFCVESPLACVAGVTGADLKKRIARIMASHRSAELSLGKKLLLGAAASAGLALPVFSAILFGTGAQAQLLLPKAGPAPSFEVAAVKQNHTAGDLFSFRLQPGRFIAEDAPLDRLIRFAYEVKSARQVVNMPGWAGSQHFDIDAKITDNEVEAMKKLSPDQRFQQYRLMVQSLLADRFQMKVRVETQELPVYALVVAKSGSKLAPAAAPPEAPKLQMPQLIYHGSGDLKASSVSMAFFVGWLSGRPDTGDRVVMDETGLKGSYDFALKWSPLESGAADGGDHANTSATEGDNPPLFTAIQEQLGLKLQPAKGPVQVLVIDHVEQPSPN